jgi:hypothetical protein
MYGCDIDDPRITDMDPVLKVWMFNNWIADQNDKAELAKNHAYLLASFSHPEAVKEIMGAGNVHESSDEEYEESLRMVKEQSLNLFKIKEDQPARRRRRKPVVTKG